MADHLIKFPRTPHLVWLGATPPRDDKVMNSTEAKMLLQRRTTVEEKVDGANLGLSVGSDGRIRAQSRGHYLEPGTAGQWKPLWRWIALRESALSSVLGTSLILFGEWCYAIHSVQYDALPDWMLVFDVYDRNEQRFWSRRRRNELARRLDIEVVPLLGDGCYSLQSVVSLLGPSALGSAAAEGIYLRWDDNDSLLGRAKVVRPGWVMADDKHWSSRQLKTNRLAQPAI